MKPKILVATRNAGKAQEIRGLLQDLPYEIAFPNEIGVRETSAEEGLETDETFVGNATRKAEYFQGRSRMPTVAEDSGIEVHALGGLPGVRSRRFAMATENQDEANNAELLRRLAGAPKERRRANYNCAVVFLPPGKVPQVFEGKCFGTILTEPRGDGGFGYDPLFYSDELAKSFGEATQEEKDTVSHRAKAFRAFAAWVAEHPI